MVLDHDTDDTAFRNSAGIIRDELELQAQAVLLEQQLREVRATLDSLRALKLENHENSTALTGEGPAGYNLQANLVPGIEVLPLLSGEPPGNNGLHWLSEIGGEVISRKQAEQELRIREARFRSLFQSMAEGFLLLALVQDDTGKPYDMRVLSVNPAFETITGFQEKDVIEKTLREALPSLHLDWIERFCAVAVTGQQGRWEEHVPLINKVLEVRAFCPEPGQCAVVFTDITARKKAELALRQSELQMRTILENLPVGVWLADETGKIVYANSTGQKIWAGARYVGIDEFHEYKAWWVDTGNPILPGDWAVARAIHKGETSLDEVIEIECFDGTHKIINNSAVPLLGENQEILGAVVVNEDITFRQMAERALKTSEARLRRLVDSNIIGVMFLDANGHIWDANDAYLNIVGYTREELAAGELWWNQLAAAEYHARAAQAIAEAKAKGACTPYEKEYIRKDGTRIPVLIGYALLEGSDSSFVCFALDLSEQKRAEAALHTYASQLELSNRDLEEFAFVASHDLQEPLRKIEAFGDALMELPAEELSDLHRDYLDRMRGAASRMRRMVDDLLELSRITTRGQKFVWVDLKEAVRDVLQDLEMSIEAEQARFEVEWLPDIFADPLQIRQLFQNLIGNAIKFHRPGVAPLIRIYSEPSGTGEVVVMVEDNGIGFREEHLEKIFQPFQRLVGRSQYEGSGIGLAICRKIVERHGGLISARSSLNAGSTFIVTLPVRADIDTGRHPR